MVEQKLNDEKRDIHTYIFNNHAPLRCDMNRVEELYLGAVDRDFGSRYVRGIVGRDGKLTLWYRFGTPYTDGHSYNVFLGCLAGAAESDKPIYEWVRGLKGEADEYGQFPIFENREECGKIANWLTDLGYGKIEVIE